MYCKNCGTKLDDNDIFCSNCGTPRDPVLGEIKDKKALKNSTVILIAAVMIVLMIGVTVGTVVHLKSGASDSYEGAVDAFISAAYRDFSIDEVSDLMNPDVLSYAAREADMSTDEYQDEIAEKLDGFHEDCPDEVDMTYEITSEKVFDEDVDDINEDLKDGGYRGAKVKAYAVVKVTLNYSDGFSEDDELMLLKIGNEWYVTGSYILFDLQF
ncbi:MAG: zinc-ribbon domain-containing protein [Acutalibacteraceae bacterium]